MKKLNLFDTFLIIFGFIVVLYLIVKQKQFCGEFLKDVFKSGQLIYLVESKLSFQSTNNLFCFGDVITGDLNSTSIFLNFNKIYYLFFTQFVMFFLSFVYTVIYKISFLRFAVFMTSVGLFFQLIFHFNSGLNIFNQSYLNTLLSVILFKFIYEKQ